MTETGEKQDELGEFIRDMRSSPPKPAVDSEQAHDCATDWAQFVTTDQDSGDEEYDAAYWDAYSRIQREYHIVRDD